MTDIISVIFYISIYLISYLIMKFGYDKKILRFIAILIPTMMATFRYNVGTDFQSYYNRFINEGAMSVKAYYSYYGNTEFISLFFNKIGYFFESFNLTLFLFAFFTLYFFSKSINILFSEDEGSLLYLLFLLSYFSTGLNIMRQVLAMSITTFAIISMTCSNKKKYYIFIMLAFFTHNTSIIMLFFRIVYKEATRVFNHLNIKNILRTLLTLCLLSGFVLLLFNIVIIKYSNYDFNSNEILKNNSFYLSLIKFLITSLFIKKLTRDNKVNMYFYFLAIIGVTLSVIGFYNIYSKRITIYFDVFNLILLSQIPYTYKNGIEKFIVEVIVVVMYIILFILQYYFLGFSNIIPYQFKIL